MIYTEHHHLTVIDLQEKRDDISYDELFQVLKEHPSTVVYVEVNGQLYGIITTGHILRSHQNGLDQVSVNRKFTSIGPGDTAKARELFRMERANEERQKVINVLPVVTSSGKLIGHYTRWDDLLFMQYSMPLLKGLNADEFISRGFHLALVKPRRGFTREQQLFSNLKETLESKEIKTEIIEFRQIFDYSGFFDYILFCDGETSHAAEQLSKLISGRNSRSIFVSYSQFINILMDDTNTILRSLQKKGIHVVTFDFEENESGYLQKFENEVENKQRRYGRGLSGKLYPEMREDFLLDFCEQFENQELPFDVSCCMKDGVLQLRDMSIPFLHVEHGHRLTTGQPETYGRCIHIFGPCIVRSMYTDDQHTIPSLLQEKINFVNLKCKVENCGSTFVRSGVQTDTLVAAVVSAPLRQGDIVVLNKLGSKFTGIQNLNLTDVLERSRVPATWILDSIVHCNHKANQIFAEAIYEMLLPVLRQPIESHQPIQKDSDPVTQLYLNRYFSGLNASDYKTVGSIVVNCNPFTYGHRYLIEEALKQVDFLIIFVVETDLSTFSFNERFSMVCAGTSDLENVMVVPSGIFILSQLTFPEYFIKEADEDIEENIENDITLFAKRIAPGLGITYRFVGEEPEDPVTNMYNQTMKRILPDYGIKLVEIPRKQNEQGIISASCVRKCLETNDSKQLRSLVPESTLNTLSIKL